MRTQSGPFRDGNTGQQLGYSMAELLVVLALAAILMSLAVPSMTSMLNSQKAKSMGTSFLASLNLARNEAIKRNARVVMCKSADSTGCVTSGGWEQGWIVFHDVNNNALLNTGEDLILTQGAVAQNLRLTGNSQVANYVSYGASGSAKMVSGAFQSGTLTLCFEPPSVPDIKKIILSATGRARLQKGLAADC
jgi:type IV fimbrial biogenesis protein FimT